MNTYIGTRTVTAKALTKMDFLEYINQPQHVYLEDDKVMGMMYEDPKGISNHPHHKGYLSWMPKLNFNAEFLDLGYIQDHAPHAQRIYAELSQLNKNLGALKLFLKTPLFLKLDFNARDLLQEQSRLMTRYVAILEQRLQH